MSVYRVVVPWYEGPSLPPPPVPFPKLSENSPLESKNSDAPSLGRDISTLMTCGLLIGPMVLVTRAQFV